MKKILMVSVMMFAAGIMDIGPMNLPNSYAANAFKQTAPQKTQMQRMQINRSAKTKAGGRQCNLSGKWIQYNTRNRMTSPLVWHIKLIPNEGAPDRYIYDVTRYKDGRRFSPPSSGRLYQSPRETLLFFDTPASMPRYNVSRIMFAFTLRVQPGCRAMNVLRRVDSWKGTSPWANVLVMKKR